MKNNTQTYLSVPIRGSTVFSLANFIGLAQGNTGQRYLVEVNSHQVQDRLDEILP